MSIPKLKMNTEVEVKDYRTNKTILAVVLDQYKHEDYPGTEVIWIEFENGDEYGAHWDGEEWELNEV